MSTSVIEARPDIAGSDTSQTAKTAAPKAAPPSPESAPPAAPIPQPDTAPDLNHSGNSSLKSKLSFITFSVGTVLAIVFGIWNRDNVDLTAETGIGYVLGIVGSIMMLLMMLYPARKRLDFMRSWGSVKIWFQTHMIMGIIAPLLVLYHANFQLGSLNSRVALYATLLISGSGIIGRFIYTKVHYGLYGGHVTLAALRDDALVAKGQLSAEFAFAPQLRSQLQGFEDVTLSPAKSFWHGSKRLISLGMRVRLTRWRLALFMRGALKLKARQLKWDRREKRRHRKEAKHFLNAYLGTVRKVAELSFYERLFSSWHLLHLPLFILLCIAATIHVVAVHMY